MSMIVIGHSLLYQDKDGAVMYDVYLTCIDDDVETGTSLTIRN
jgi:hypothetical protein